MSSEFGPFSLTRPKYDQSIYSGRLRHFVEMVDPRTLLTSDATLQRCQLLLEQYKGQRLPSGVTDDDLWDARRIKEACIHPVTGEKMFWPGRMSAFVLMNVPTAVGMLAASTPLQRIFWQWANQSYNVVNNYTNRSGADVDTAEIGKAYGLAVATSCGLAVGLGKAVEVAPPAIKRLGIAVPWAAVVCAGSANLLFTRRKELEEGVSVRSADGRELGVSKRAASLAVQQTVVSRCMFLPVFPLLLPPLMMQFAKQRIGAMGNKRVAFIAEVAAITGCIAVGLPCAIAIFPQEIAINTASLEPEFQNLTDSSGRPINEVFANKGL